MKRIALAIGFLLGNVAIAFGADAPNATGPSVDRTLIVRFDDYTPNPLPGHSAARIEQVRQLFDLFERRRAILVVGIVPLAESDAVPRKPETVTANESWLSNAENPWTAILHQYVDRGVVEPSLHGFTHRRSSDNHRPGEFEGKPQAWQLSAMRVGRTALENALGKPIRGFIPPWNAWDSATLRAMDDLGFEWLSPDLHHADAGDTKLRIIPQCSYQPSEVLQWMREDRIPAGATVVLVTHPFDFDDPRTGDTYFASLDELLSMMNGSSHWRCSGFSDAISRTPALGSPQGFADAVNDEQLRTLGVDSLGGRWWPHAPTYLLADENARAARVLKVEVLLLVLLTLVAASSLAYFFAVRLQVPKGWSSIAILSVFSATVVLLFGAWNIHQRGYHVRGIRWQCLIACAGVLAGLVTSRRRVELRTRLNLPSSGNHALQSLHDATAR